MIDKILKDKILSLQLVNGYAKTLRNLFSNRNVRIKDIVNKYEGKSYLFFNESILWNLFT